MSRVVCRDCAKFVRQSFEGIVHGSIFALVRCSEACAFCAYLVERIGEEDLELLLKSAKGRYLPVQLREQLGDTQNHGVKRYELTVARVPRASSKRYEMLICTNQGMPVVILVAELVLKTA
jgi:hypothetical protein